MSKRSLAVLVVAGLLAAATPSLAQNPSADSIINSLTPRGNMSSATRGIRLPGGPAPTPSAATPAVERPTGHIARRPATPTAATGTAAPREPATAAQEAPSVNLTVQFANDSAQLTPAAMRTLDELGRALSSNTLASYHFRIEGHTDTLGAPDHNQQLSDMRARAVVGYLVGKFHVDPSRLEAVGMGESELLVPTGQNVAEPRNRRVTVVNVGA